ncbi:MAG: DUF932 domain-containing protein [Candidatus Marinimicrobia bacterium]|jgi:hypothetical protein|nr:DUF932 domain-containing protein [Candidatus Neomarinimicrobiota bacterium]MBT7832004.1 DUF932 domain-containing protein [Candidatus Neomarinimicrobiota bacterium]
MSLLLHCGAESATLDELASIPLPKETRTYKPVPHQALVSMLGTIASDLLPEFELVNTQFGLARDGAQMFGVHTLKNGSSAMGLSIGFRNSYNKSLSIGIAVGGSVFVCDNLCLHGDVTVLKKHTLNVVASIESLALSAIYRSRSAFNHIQEDAEVMKDIPLSDEDAYRTIGLIYGRGIITPRQIPVVKKEWLEPSHDAFAGRNLWSFYNAVTEALKSSPPQSIMERHLAIHKQLTNHVAA